MLYPGDIKNLICSIINATGADPDVTVPPTVSVIQMSTQAIVLSAQAMNLISGTQAVYYYAWDTTGMTEDDYLAVVSYAADSIAVNGRFLEEFRIGDTNITGPVALQSTVALNATVAKDATVAHLSDLASINPNTSSVVLAIQAAVENLPADPASTSDVTAVGDTVSDLYNYTFGTWTINKTVNPQTLTILAPGGSSLATFVLTDSTTLTSRAPQ